LEILFLTLLLWKHAFVDLPLQRQLGPLEKQIYFGEGHKHYVQHGIGTLLVSIPFFSFQTVILIAILDYIAHWHIDYFKHIITKNKYYPISERSIQWWYLTALDQALHFSTYILLFYFFAN
jgi:hypothetical protein